NESNSGEYLLSDKKNSTLDGSSQIGDRSNKLKDANCLSENSIKRNQNSKKCRNDSDTSRDSKEKKRFSSLERYRHDHKTGSRYTKSDHRQSNFLEDKESKLRHSSDHESELPENTKEDGQISSENSSDREIEEDNEYSANINEEGFYVIDCGSTHGTFLNQKRLSEPKVSSKPTKLAHLDIIVIGSTTFQVHIHSGFPCGSCSLSSNNVAEPSTASLLSSEPIRYIQQDEEENLIKKNEEYNKSQKGLEIGVGKNKNTSRPKKIYKYGSRSNQVEDTGKNKYMDRAAARRNLAQNVSLANISYEGTDQYTDSSKPSKIFEHIESNNTGYKMLSKMGWQHGNPLGGHTPDTAKVEPVLAKGVKGKGGIGSGANYYIGMENTSPGQGYKKKNAHITLQRYYKDS
ncbi:hypothetical protein BB560_006167, partial [Smittium megazygosporum]